MDFNLMREKFLSKEKMKAQANNNNLDTYIRNCVEDLDTDTTVSKSTIII